MAKLTCPQCGGVLVGLPVGFFCNDCGLEWQDDDIMPPSMNGIHQRDKRRAQNLVWRKVTVSEARQQRLLDETEG